MSIQTTKKVKRNFAIERIVKINSLFLSQNWRELDKISGEYDFDYSNDVYIDLKEYYKIDISNVLNWTNKKLEEVLDKPFYRESMFNNYSVED